MKSFKHLLAAILSVALIASSVFSLNVFADEAEINFKDVAENHQYYDAIYTLAKEGVVNGIKQEDGTLAFKPEDTITRAEVATLIAIALVKDEALLTSTTDKFPDVPQEHWANKYIAYAVQSGIIAGNDDGTFRPANPVTYGEAVKMLICAKGYGAVYEPTTPWYEGFVTIANQKGLTKGAAGVGSMEAPRGLVAQLVYNLRNVDYYQPKTQPSVGGGGGGGGGRISKDVEEENEFVKGVVTAVYESTLTGEKHGLTYKQMMIDDVVYDIGDYSLDRLYNYLGKRVDVEYSVKPSGKKILEKIETSSKNSIEKILSDDFISVSSGEAGREIAYYPYGENDSEIATLSKNLCVIYNGFAVPKQDVTDEFIEKYLNVECGEIELINNNGGKDYEVAIVSRYETYFPTSRTVSETTYTLTDANMNTTVTLSEGDCTVREITSLKGKLTEAKMTTLAVNKVVAVAVPYDRTEGTNVIVSSSTIKSAVVEAISDNYVTIEGREYKKSLYFEKLLKTEDAKKFNLVVGTKGDFYFDHQGDIAFFKKADNTDPYAYVLGFDNGEGLNGVCSIYMYAISGSNATPKVFAFRDTVKVNGHNKKPSELGSILKANADVINAKSLANEAKILNGEYSQLVRYKSSNITINGEPVPCLTEIYTIDPDELEEGVVVPGIFRTGKEGEKSAFTDGKNKLKYNSSYSAFQDESGVNQFKVDKSTVVLLIPDDRINEKEYKKKTYSSYFSNGIKYDIEPYDIKSSLAGVVLVYTRGVSTAATIAANAKVAFVENVSSRLNSEGKTVQMLSYYLSGETALKTMLTEKDTTIPTEIKPGDLIRFAYEQCPEEKNVTEKTSVLTGVQRVFVGGQLYDWKEGSVFETLPAEGNVISHKYSSTNDYYQVVHGTLDSKSIDGGIGSINVVPVIVDNKDDYQGNWMPYSITTSTKLYKWDSEEDKFVIADVTYLQSVEDSNGDPTSASKLVVIKNATNNTAQAIYVLG